MTKTLDPFTGAEVDTAGWDLDLIKGVTAEIRSDILLGVDRELTDDEIDLLDLEPGQPWTTMTQIVALAADRLDTLATTAVHARDLAEFFVALAAGREVTSMQRAAFETEAFAS